MAKDYNYADCSNCREPIPMSEASQALIMRQGEQTVATVCVKCQQQAKKIQLTLRRLATEGVVPCPRWEYFQFFPVET
jgi:RNA polymerase-binding transcription factor DksA